MEGSGRGRPRPTSTGENGLPVMNIAGTRVGIRVLSASCPPQANPSTDKVPSQK